MFFKDGFGFWRSPSHRVTDEPIPLGPMVMAFDDGYHTWIRRWFREGRSVVPEDSRSVCRRVLWTPASDDAQRRVKGAKAIWAFRNYLLRLTGEDARRSPPVGPDEIAERLLSTHLTPQQRLSLAGDGYFDMEAPSGRRYRICRDTMQNVYRHVGDHSMQYCAVLVTAEEEYPVADMMLAQKLMIENDEPRFLDTARKWGSEPSLWTPEGEEDAC